MKRNFQNVDRLLLRVAKVSTYYQGNPMTNATGFFFLHNSFLYLITARHVVINESLGHFPDYLGVSLHTSQRDLSLRTELSIALYSNGLPQWRQHPHFMASMDCVAVAVNDPQVLANCFVDTFSFKDLVGPGHQVPLGQDVLIVGFPLGFHDTYNNLPIVRKATVASSYAHPFKGEPYFLTDARMHRGSSGSPVIAQIGDATKGDGDNSSSWRLLGIHSSALDVSDRDIQMDEKLALNTAWYAHHILEILPDSDSTPPLAKP
jgi:hypothetical protein